MKSRIKFISFLGGFLIVALAVSLIAPALQAAQMTSVTFEMSDYTTSADPVTYTIKFDPVTNVDASWNVKLTFESGVDLATNTVGDSDISISSASGTITKGTATVSSQLVTIPISSVSSPDGIYTVTIANIVNPGSAGDYTVDIVTDNGSTDQDSASAAAYVIGDNTVDITGTVDPTLTLTLSTTTCALGVLSSSTIETCSYDATVSTNASSGYSGYLQSDAGLVSGSNEITGVADSAVSAGAEEYGVGVDTTDTTSAFSDYSGTDTCANLDGGTTDVPANALDNSAQTFATASAPVDGSSTGVTTLCHAASITGTTPAGSYTQTVTVTVVGNF